MLKLILMIIMSFNSFLVAMEGPNIKKDVEALADLIRHAKYPIIFTGAGLSTSAGIGDFRGPNGAWTIRDKQNLGEKVPDFQSIDFKDAHPTLGHMAIKTLLSKKIIRFVVSQNVDGLHMRSGIPTQNLAELHGNDFKSVCFQCKSEFVHEESLAKTSNMKYIPAEKMRWDYVPAENEDRYCNCPEYYPQFCHCTGIYCKNEECLEFVKNSLDPDNYRGKQFLKDSIIHFKESLPENELNKAINQLDEADLCIVLGSSLSVSPAKNIPEFIAKKNNSHLVIINKQSTQLDELAIINIQEDIDLVMGMLLKELNLTQDLNNEISQYYEKIKN